MDTISHIRHLSEVLDTLTKEIKTIEAEDMNEFKDKRDVIQTMTRVKAIGVSICDDASSSSEESKAKFIDETKKLIKLVQKSISEYRLSEMADIEDFRDE